MVAWVLMPLVAQPPPVDTAGAVAEGLHRSVGLYAAVFYGLILLLILVFGGWALLRISRRYQERLRCKPGKPTPVPDVWSMHRPPDETDTREQNEEPDYEP